MGDKSISEKRMPTPWRDGAEIPDYKSVQENDMAIVVEKC